MKPNLQTPAPSKITLRGFVRWLGVLAVLAMVGFSLGVWWTGMMNDTPAEKAANAVLAAEKMKVAQAPAKNGKAVGMALPFGSLGLVPDMAHKAFQSGPYRKGELIIRAGTDAELAALLKQAQQAGGMLVDIIPGMRAARLRFTDETSMGNFLQVGFGGLQGAVGAVGPELNYTVTAPTPISDPSAPGSLVPFGNGAMSSMGVPASNSNFGRGVMMAILDTGLSPGAINLLQGGSVNEVDLVGGAAPVPGHADMVASLLDGTSGQQGISPGASLLSVRVLDSNNTGDVFTVAQGLMTAVQQGAKIINMSLGTDQTSSMLQDAVTAAQASGALLVAAVGNDGLGLISYPAAYDGVVAVGAVDATGQRATFSNYGPQIQLSAPGVGVNTQTEAGTMSFSGTSAAAPLVAGAIAAVMSSDPSLSPQQAVGLLEQYANYAGPVSTNNWNDFYGYGVVDLGRVLNRNNTSLADVAMADAFLNLSGVSTTASTDGTATAPLSIEVQNRGNQPYAAVQLNYDVNGSTGTQMIRGLGPNQVQAVTVNVPVSQLLSGGVIVNANVQGMGTDTNPNNNNLSRLLKITPPSSTTGTTASPGTTTGQ